MATVAPQHPPSTRAAPAHNPNDTARAANGDRSHDITANGATPVPIPAPQQPPTVAVATKKAKGKKAPDPIDAEKQLAAKIAQLEQEKVGDREVEAEIIREVRKENRALDAELELKKNPLEKIEFVRKRLDGHLASMEKHKREATKRKKEAERLAKEKEKQKSEYTKEYQNRERMEKLARTLQSDNKKLKDDVKRLEETESAVKEDLHQRLETIASEIEDVINQKEHPEDHSLTTETDEMFRHKFKSFVEQYELRELHFNSVLKTKDLEVAYHVARYEQQKKAQQQEADKSRNLSTQVTTFSQTETELRNQLNIYVEKFKQVEDTLNNSNDLFLTFRKEMEEMSKKTKRLEKENLTLTRKIDLLNRNMLDMAEERTEVKKENETLIKKNAKLENLCRALQDRQRRAMRVDENGMPLDDGATDSEYEYDDEGASEDGYDEDTEEEAVHAQVQGPPSFGPVPPPPPQQQPTSQPPRTLATIKVNGQMGGQPNGQVNGVKP